MILKFNTCLVLMKNVEHFVKSSIDVWKDVLHLPKPSEDPVEVKGDNSGKDKDDEEDNTHCVTINSKEYQDLMKDGEEEKEYKVEEKDKEE